MPTLPRSLGKHHEGNTMSEEILVNVTPRETRVAVVENGMLQELHIERGGNRGVVGNIYKGKVQRVMPGMQAAFVEIGLDRAAFLHANDIQRPMPAREGEGADAMPAPAVPAPVPLITELLRDGQEIVVQVVKDPIGSKGARLTTQISIPSRYLVLLPQSRQIGVSARIEDEDERARLKALVTSAPVGDLASSGNNDSSPGNPGHGSNGTSSNGTSRIKTMVPATSCAPTPKASLPRRWPKTSRTSIASGP